MTQYHEWIARNYPTQESAYGRCDDATVLMKQAFPDLVRVRGHFYDAAWGQRSHWWLMAPDGSIVDPTAVQFPSGGRGVYEPWIEGDAEPTGKCPNCGEYVYDGGTVCSDACGNDYAAYLMR